MINFKIPKVAKFCLITSLVIIGFLAGVFFQKIEDIKISGNSIATKTTSGDNEATVDKQKVLPEEGFVLPISWGDFGPRLISLGVIDEEKFVKTVNLNSEEEKILKEGGNIPVVINEDNSQFVVDLLWAIGLGQKSIVYTEGPMGTDYKKDAGNFASTGGFSLAKGNATSHLGRHELLNLTDEQQKKVAEIAKNVYRPCCGNSTWFPDCNHGMAALAAIEMMVVSNISEPEIYKNLLKLNSFWFPSTYMTTAAYFAKDGISWDKVDAKLVLGEEYSSAKGAADIARKVDPQPGVTGGGSCGA